jgi:hypothetical protein
MTNPTPKQIANAKLLKQLFDKSDLQLPGRWEYRKLKSKLYMPLSVDRLYEDAQGHHFALAHNGVLNGDLMADPDMEIVWNENPGGEPYIVAMHYQNDYMGVFKSVERENTTQAALDDFLGTWLKNLLEQGHVVRGEEDDD